MKRTTFLFIVLLMVSCTKDELGPQCLNCSTQETATQLADVLIVNEGTFNWNNASISLYQPGNKTTRQSIFSQANSGLPLGDIAQSITQFNNSAYIVINNANKIEVVDVHSFETITTITGFTSPRYFLPITSNKAYVTDLYSNSIQIVDLNNNTISGSIPANGWTEEMVLLNDSVYVCDMTHENLIILDPSNNSLLDSIKLGEDPNSIVIDQNHKIWILCSGGINSTLPKLIKFNPKNRSIENIFTFSNISNSPSNLKINTAGDHLYFLNSNVYKMNINETILPSTPFILNNNNTFYSLGIDPINEEIYVSDAIDYVQNGVIYRYASTGALIDQFNCGIIPGSFLFLQ
jgi:hypothetical protein